MSSVTFLYALKKSENLRFSDVFRGYKKVTLDINRLNSYHFEQSSYNDNPHAKDYSEIPFSDIPSFVKSHCNTSGRLPLYSH